MKQKQNETEHLLSTEANKYRLLEDMEEQTKCYCGHTTTCDCGPEKPKQETLEEVAENYIQENIPPYSENKWMYKKCFIDGYWLAQQEQGYSEEDLECAWYSSYRNMRFQFSSSAYKAITFNQWLEKFKQEINQEQ
jgi:hypothetical protein